MTNREKFLRHHEHYGLKPDQIRTVLLTPCIVKPKQMLSQHEKTYEEELKEWKAHLAKTKQQ